MILSESERLEDLQCGDLKIIQDKKLYTFTSDSVILAKFVKTKKKEIAVEIGAGCGVISILVQAKNEVEHIFSFEIQEKMADLCQKNLELNNLGNKITLVRDDVKNFKKYIKPASVDVVFSNPPFYKTTNFEQNLVKKYAKEEVLLPIESLVETTSLMLKNGGSFYCVYGAERACELITLCQNKNLTVKEMFFTENGKGKTQLVVLKCVKGGKNGVKVLPNLVTNDENGDYLEKLHTKYITTKKD